MFNIAITFIFLIISLFFLGLTSYNIYLNNKRNYWKKLKGKVIKSEITQKKDEYSLGTDPYSSSTDINFREEIEYQYTYNNEKFTSTKIFYLDFNRTFLFAKDKKELVSKYPLDKAINVYIDPKNAKKVFIEKNIPIIYPLIYSIISLIISIFIYF